VIRRTPTAADSSNNEKRGKGAVASTCWQVLRERYGRRLGGEQHLATKGMAPTTMLLNADRRTAAPCSPPITTLAKVAECRNSR